MLHIASLVTVNLYQYYTHIVIVHGQRDSKKANTDPGPRAGSVARHRAAGDDENKRAGNDSRRHTLNTAHSTLLQSILSHGAAGSAMPLNSVAAS